MMKTVIRHGCLVLFVFGLLGFCYTAKGQERWKVPASANTLKNPYSQEDIAAIKQGQQLYITWCALCHGPSGDGAGSAGQAWDPPPADFTSKKVQQQSDGALFWKIMNGSPSQHMQSYKKVLSKEQVWKLVSYIRQFGHTTQN